MHLLLKLVFSFYQKFLLLSLLLNFLFVGFEIPLFPAMIYKAFFALGLLWIYKIAERGKKLIFYNNFKLNSWRLFGLCLAIDLLSLLLTYLICAVIL